MIELDDEIRDRLARAIDEQRTVSAAYVDVEGKPHISFYGSTHVYADGADGQLAIWVRNPEGALIQTLPDRPCIAFIYGDIGDRVYYTFEGRGRVTADPQERERVYQGMHAIERYFDPDRKGAAVLVELDKVTVLSAADGKRVMHKDG